MCRKRLFLGIASWAGIVSQWHEAKNVVLIKGFKCLQIDRKLVKQTVMTSVYGVTFVGARSQVWNRLKERDIMASDDDKDLYKASCYAAKVNLW